MSGDVDTKPDDWYEQGLPGAAVPRPLWHPTVTDDDGNVVRRNWNVYRLDGGWVIVP